jgi:hypothetical protein
LGLGDTHHQVLDFRDLGCPRGEPRFKLRLERDDGLSDRDSLSPHRPEELLGSLELFGAESKCPGGLQNVDRAGIVIELGGKRQAHAAPAPQIVDLLL